MRSGTICIISVIVTWIMTTDAQISFEEVLPSSCATQSLYFDFGTLSCRNCSTGQQVDTSGYSCSCQSTYAQNVQSPRILQCTLCPSRLTTPDGYFCATCSSGSCSCAATESLTVAYSALGTATMSCTSCSETYLAVTGSQSCNPCPDCESVCTATGTSPIYAGGLCFNDTLVASLNLASVPTSTNAYVNENLVAAYGACVADGNGIKNQTACASLANMCVMEQYSSDASSCAQYRDANSNQFEIPGAEEWRTQRLPWLYYEIAMNDDILLDDTITEVYNFSPDTVLDLVVAQYRANGTFLGMASVQNGLIQLCQDKSTVSNAAYEFGTEFASSCTLSVSDLLVSDVADTYYSMYLRYTSTTGSTLLHPVPVLVSNYEGDTGTVNQESDTSEWQLVSRFFLVDTLSLNSVSEIQYAYYLQLDIELKPATSTGSIYPPLLHVTYQTASTDAGTTVEAIFNVHYIASTFDQREGLKISMSILGVLAVLYAAVEASGWRRRQGLPFIEFNTIVHFVIYTISNAANMFFVVMFGYTFVLLFYFKGQMIATTYVPANNSYETYLFFVFICCGFVFKAISVIIMIFKQSFVDIFFLDWERPRSQQAAGDADKISIWRTYFIANEWNEIQTSRKVNTTLQLFIVVFFLEIVNFKNFALLNASTELNPSSDIYTPAYSDLLRFGVSMSVFIVVELLQLIYFKLIHERFISDRMRDFVDLCSVSNVSVFILSQQAYGYYIHGRSIHGKADTDMTEMNIMMKREEEDLVPRRGLETGSDKQVFELLIPPKMRVQYDKIYEPLQQQIRSQPQGNGGMGRDTNVMNDQMRAYGVMKKFLTSFLDHGLKDLDYRVREKLFLEKILGIEFQDSTEEAFFTIGDDNSFADILFYGNEFALFLFDVLLFSLVDYGSENFLLAAVLTYLVGMLLRLVRNQLSRHNLAKKTLIDKRFLI